MDLTPAKPASPRGRKPDERKRKAIVAAASRLFLRHGYGSSVDAIAQEAAVSKQTVYKAFGTKDGLFAAVSAKLADEIAAPLAETRTEGATPREVLTDFARQLASVVQAEHAIALHRMLVAEQAQFPEAARTFYRMGPGHTVEKLAEYLRREVARGRLVVEDPSLAAEHFLGMLNGHGYMRRLLGVETRQTPEILERRIAAAISVFLRAYGTAGQQS